MSPWTLGVQIYLNFPYFYQNLAVLRNYSKKMNHPFPAGKNKTEEFRSIMIIHSINSSEKRANLFEAVQGVVVQVGVVELLQHLGQDVVEGVHPHRVV